MRIIFNYYFICVLLGVNVFKFPVFVWFHKLNSFGKEHTRHSPFFQLINQNDKFKDI